MGKALPNKLHFLPKWDASFSVICQYLNRSVVSDSLVMRIWINLTSLRVCRRKNMLLVRDEAYLITFYYETS